MSTVVSENFLQLNVMLKHTVPMVTEDKAAMTPIILLSNIGGSLSLWLGLGVVFIFEIVDLVIGLCRSR